jgi:hypothetical protein
MGAMPKGFRDPEKNLIQNIEIKPDPRINIIEGKPPLNPPCRYSSIYDNGVGWVLYCNIMMRYLTKFEAENCLENANRCPLIKYNDMMLDL